MLRVKEPKTRGKHARHQAARIDPSDIVILLGIAHGKLGDEENFWPYSASRLRKRLSDVLRALELPQDGERKARQFDL